MTKQTAKPEATGNKTTKKDDKKRTDKANALFAGISGVQSKHDESESDSDDNTP